MEITLAQLLDAREERARHQAILQREYPCPLICFTMNIAGPEKTSPKIERAFRQGLYYLDKALREYPVLKKQVEYNICGPVAYYSVEAPSSELKNICTEIEDSCSLGRLFDMDVLYNKKKLERATERRCLICGKTGRYCSASRAHSVSELQEKTTKIITEHFTLLDSDLISSLARDCLIAEVLTTPKPGLVDSNNSGSHKDMDIETFIKSAESLLPYFQKAVAIGIESHGASHDDTFQKLRTAGIEGEKNMYLATNGINTHKGMIYSMGVLLCAVGRLWSAENPHSETDKILKECALLVKESTKRDFAKIDGATAGGRLYLEKGIRGIRGEVAKGFPSVKNISLPAYKKALAEGKSKNDSGIFALLNLIACIYDTNVYSRGGEDGLKFVQNYAKKILSEGIPDNSDVELMDIEFIKRNLSSGGAADLLAVTYFLAEIENFKFI